MSKAGSLGSSPVRGFHSNPLLCDVSEVSDGASNADPGHAKAAHGKRSGTCLAQENYGGGSTECSRRCLCEREEPQSSKHRDLAIARHRRETSMPQKVPDSFGHSKGGSSRPVAITTHNLVLGSPTSSAGFAGANWPYRVQSSPRGGFSFGPGLGVDGLVASLGHHVHTLYLGFRSHP